MEPTEEDLINALATLAAADVLTLSIRQQTQRIDNLLIDMESTFWNRITEAKENPPDE